jgi:peptidoglycan/LPS O-acetylase OafA/YrhL
VGVYYRGNVATAVGRVCIDLGLLAGTVWAVTHIPDPWMFSQTVPSNLAVALPAAAVIGWLHRFDSRTAGLRVLAPLRWCGVRCYSLYLVHSPITSSLSWSLYRAGLTSSAETLLVTVPLCLAASALAAWGFHRWVEARFLNSTPVSHAAVPTATSGASATVTSRVRCPVES